MTVAQEKSLPVSSPGDLQLPQGAENTKQQHQPNTQMCGVSSAPCLPSGQAGSACGWEEQPLGACPECPGVGKRSHWSMSRCWHPKLMCCESCAGGVQNQSASKPNLAGTGIPEGCGSLGTGVCLELIIVFTDIPSLLLMLSSPRNQLRSQSVPSHHHSPQVPVQQYLCQGGAGQCPLSRNLPLGTLFCPFQDGGCPPGAEPAGDEGWHKWVSGSWSLRALQNISCGKSSPLCTS